MTEPIRTVIRAGLPQPVRLMHLTDTHLAYADDRNDAEKRRLAKRRQAEFGDTDLHSEKELLARTEYAEKNCDLLLHTGDLIDFVSEANLDRAGAFLRNENVFFVAGNHEFSQYVGEAWEDRAYKMNSYMQIRKRLGVDLFFSSRVVKGLNIVGIDNGYYRFEDWQIGCLKREAERGYPILLCMHVPLYEKSLFECVMDEHRSSSGLLVGCGEDELLRYEEYRQVQQRPDETTMRMIDYIAGEDKIIALVTGHLHFSFESRLPCGKMQYVTGGSYDGIAREVTVI